MAKLGHSRAALDPAIRAMTVHARWTQSHISELRERVGAGQSAADIAAALNREDGDVQAMMVRLRLREAAGPR